MGRSAGLLVLGKGMSGGIYPMSATCYRPFLQSFFDADPFVHVSSFGGSELGCTVCLAMLNEVSKPEFLAHVAAMGDRFAAGLSQLREAHPEMMIGFRQKGLMIAVLLAERRCGPAMTGFGRARRSRCSPTTTRGAQVCRRSLSGRKTLLSSRAMDGALGGHGAAVGPRSHAPAASAAGRIPPAQQACRTALPSPERRR
jgi:acetylornithine/succinyldiaminopimelate/putrescine aminotransferase